MPRGRSRLPSPPGSGGAKTARPLPPAPSPEEDVPPPLPARPPGPGPQRGMPPPPSRPQPTQEESSDEEDQGVYEEAEAAPDPPPPPPPSRIAPPPVGSHDSMGGEIYDDLDEVIETGEPGEDTYSDPGDEFEQTNYDECDIREAKPPARNQGKQSEVFEEELYEVPPDEPIKEEELIEETEYEFVPQNETPSPPPPPPPSQPSLPVRPPPSRKEPTSEPIPELPSRPTVGQSPGPKKQSTGFSPGIGISLGDLSSAKGRLRKVSSEDKKEPCEGSDGSTGSQVKSVKSDSDSFAGRMEMFKKAEGDEASDPDFDSVQQTDSNKQSLRPPSGQNAPNHSPRSPKRVASPHLNGEATKFDYKPPTDVSNLTIKERIALMQGKNMGPVAVQPSAAKPAIAKKPATLKKPERLEQPSNDTDLNHAPKEKPKRIPEESKSLNSVGHGVNDHRSSLQSKKPDSPPPPPPPEPEPEENLIEEDIYDDGGSCIPLPPDPLAEFPWYHFDVDRHVSDNKLNKLGQDGSFLVRKSQRGGDNQPYTLVVLYKGHVYNLKVRRRPDTKVALGEEKPDELAFKDVPALISYHRNNDVVLVNTKEKKQYKTLLTKFPPYT